MIRTFWIECLHQNHPARVVYSSTCLSRTHTAITPSNTTYKPWAYPTSWRSFERSYDRDNKKPLEMRQQKTTFITGRDGGRRAYKRDFTTTRASLIYLLLGFLKSTFMFTFIFANYQNSQPCTLPRNFTLNKKWFFFVLYSYEYFVSCDRGPTPGHSLLLCLRRRA